ncbi:MAG: hypothetical protein LBM28_01240 [Oscillospiraceae bacterium]|jgi:hypothetical protein|nr:hypothetical protein [Oscillospiraceae bacterium]
MEDLITSLIHALSSAGLHVVRAMNAQTLPRLQSPMVAVGMDTAKCEQNAISYYLGQDAQGKERYGMQLGTTVLMEVFSPGTGDGALCDDTVCRLIDVFLQGFDGANHGDMSIAGTAYDAKTDCFRCKVRVPLFKRLYASDNAGLFQSYTIQGVSQ